LPHEDVWPLGDVVLREFRDALLQSCEPALASFFRRDPPGFIGVAFAWRGGFNRLTRFHGSFD
jgi:hypothetical protein